MSTETTSKNETAIFYVQGAYGTLVACAVTGQVVAYEDREENDGESYDGITRMDIDEWRKHYPGQTLGGTSMDILDIGYWEGEKYEEPEHGWREDMQAGRAPRHHEIN